VNIPEAVSSAVCTAVLSGRARRYVDPRELSSQHVLSLAQDRAACIWIGTPNGLHLFDGLVWSIPSTLVELRERQINCLCISDDSTLWVGTDNAGVAAVRVLPVGSRFEASLTDANGLPSRTVHALARDGAGRLWVATPSGAAVIEGGKVVRRLSTVDGLPSNCVRCLCSGREGSVWLGTDAGLAVVTADGPIHAITGLAESAPWDVTSVCCDPAGVIWAGTSDGKLFQLDSGQNFDTTVRSVHDCGAPVGTCVPDRFGRIWVGLPGGASVFADGTSSGSVGAADGLPVDGVAPVLFCDEQGRMWAGTTSGLLELPGALTPDQHDAAGLSSLCAHAQGAGVASVSSPVYLSGFYVQGVAWEFDPGFVLEDSLYDLQFEFGSANYTAPGRVLYRTQLQGQEPGWSPPTTQRTRRFTNLRPGQFVFRVAACHEDGAWGNPLELPFTVVREMKAQAADEARFNERFDKELQRRTAERLQELDRLVAETEKLRQQQIEYNKAHAETMEHLSQHDALTGVLNRRATNAELAREFERAKRYGQPLSIAVVDVDLLQKINDRFGHQAGDEVLRIVAKVFASNVRGVDVVGRYGGDEFVILMPNTSAHMGLAVCERLRLHVAEYDWTSIAEGMQVTVSIGVTDWVDALNHEKMVADAETFLQQAKLQGRNRSSSIDL